MQDWRTKENRDIRPETRESKIGSNIFSSPKESRQLYGLEEGESLVAEINIGGPSEKACMLTELLIGKLQELRETRERVRIVSALDSQSKQIIPDRLAIIAGPVKV